MKEHTMLSAMGSLATKAHRGILQGNLQAVRDSLAVMCSYGTDDEVYSNAVVSAAENVQNGQWLDALDTLATLSGHCHQKAAEIMRESSPQLPDTKKGKRDGMPG